MKALNVMALALAAFGAFATAQEPAEKSDPMLRTSLLYNKKWVNVMATDVKGRAIIILNPTTGEPMQMTLRAPYVIHTPKELDDAMDDYRGGNIKVAMKKFKAVREKYAAFRDLPANPALTAALCELDCAMRLQDWTHLKTVGDLVAGKRLGNPTTMQVPTILAARYVAQGMIDGTTPEKAKKLHAAIEKQVRKYAAMEAEGGKVEEISLRPYGWYCYCLGRLSAAQLPEEEVKGTISAAHLAVANDAIDRLCQAAVCAHGSAPELTQDAMLRALHLLYAMPGVKEFADSRASMGTMDAGKWNQAPADFKDAAALAHLIKTVYAPECTDELVEKLATRYFNTQAGKKNED